MRKKKVILCLMRPNTNTTSLPLIKRKVLSKDSLKTLGGFALLAICAQIKFYLPGNPVAVSAQTFAVLFIGLSLSPLRAFFSVLLYLSLAFLGLPLLTGGMSGMAILGLPSAGYLIGFLLAAPGMSAFKEKFGDSSFSIMGAIILGQFLIYLPGLMILSNFTDDVWGMGFIPFVPGLIFKSIAAFSLFWGRAKFSAASKKRK